MKKYILILTTCLTFIIGCSPSASQKPEYNKDADTTCVDSTLQDTTMSDTTKQVVKE